MLVIGKVGFGLTFNNFNLIPLCIDSNYYTIDSWISWGLQTPTLWAVQSLCTACSQPFTYMVPLYLRFALHPWVCVLSKLESCNIVVFTIEKIAMYKCTHPVQTHVVQCQLWNLSEGIFATLVSMKEELGDWRLWIQGDYNLPLHNVRFASLEYLSNW